MPHTWNREGHIGPYLGHHHWTCHRKTLHNRSPQLHILGHSLQTETTNLTWHETGSYGHSPQACRTNSNLYHCWADFPGQGLHTVQNSWQAPGASGTPHCCTDHISLGFWQSQASHSYSVITVNMNAALNLSQTKSSSEDRDKLLLLRMHRHWCMTTNTKTVKETCHHQQRKWRVRLTENKWRPMNLTDTYRASSLTAEECIFFTMAHGAFSNIDHILEHRRV